MAALDNTQVKEGVEQETIDAVREVGSRYKHGWETEIEMDYAPKGLTPDIVRLISEKNEEPQWMTDWRLGAYERWLQKKEPNWAMVDYPQIDFQDQYYYARPNPFIVPQEDAFAGTWEVGVALSMDLWTWGRTRAQVDRAQAQRRQAQAQRDDVQAAVRLDVTRQVLAVRRAIEAVQVTEQGRQEAEAAYQNLQAQFQQGAALTAELLAAEATFRRAELRHAEARADYAIARAALRRALGDDPRRP